MKKIWDGEAEEKHAYHGKNYAINCAIQGVRLIWKQKIWLAICEFLWSFDLSECLVCYLFSALFKKNCTVLNQSEWGSFFMHIINKQNTQTRD